MIEQLPLLAHNLPPLALRDRVRTPEGWVGEVAQVWSGRDWYVVFSWDWRDLVAAYEDMRAENAAVRRAARQLVVAWREQRQRAAYWEGATDLYRQALQQAQERADRLSGAETNENSPDHPTV